ncbi:MAG TPA: Do family serine endopeptidase, partial [Novosphingobium sp.]|nr:Do family serine endopeptidase [Novosphingobium sp.]
FANDPFYRFFMQDEAFGYRQRREQSLGSGVVVSPDGYVLTNNHVVGNARAEVTVLLPDKSEMRATIVGVDEDTDIAVLKVDAKNLPTLPWGDSSKLRVAEWVLAVGNPFGVLSQTVTLGIVSATGRSLEGRLATYEDFIQTDAAINRGNSGGPMFDMKGNVIGINNAIFSPTGGSVGIGFAIPAEIAAPIVESLKRGETIQRGYLGVRIQAVDEDLAASLGIAHNKGEFVQAVEPGGAAASAGIQAGDVVLKVAGKEVTRDQTLSYLVANTSPGTRIPVELIRNGRRMTVTATVGKRPTEEELAQQQFDPEQEQGGDQFGSAPQQQQGGGVSEQALGLAVLPLTPQIARQLGASDNTTGLVINAVDPNSDAGAKGLRRGDIILTANYTGVRSIADLETAIRSAKRDKRDALLLSVQRRGQPATYVPIRLR